MSTSKVPAGNYEPVARKTVLIIGYGIAGSQLACQLSAKKENIQIIVLTPHEFMEVPYKMTFNLAAGPEEHSKSIFPLLKQPDIEYKIAYCSSLTNESCTTSKGEVIPFDVCVVATGSNYPIFMADPKVSSGEERKTLVSNMHDKIKAAKTIVIAGGGPVGAETAADIKLRFPDKSIKVVHPFDNIVQNMTAPFPQLATDAIKRMGVEIVKDRILSVDFSETVHTIKLASGQTITCDLYIKSNSSGVNSEFVPKKSLDEKGRIIVNENLIAKDLNHVFAIGDCSNRAPPSGVQASDQVPITVANVVALSQNKPVSAYVQSGMALSRGPMMLALGHDLPGGFGVGPDFVGCMSWIPWLCCGPCGSPCSAPSGAGIAKMKSDFNSSVSPKMDRGLAA